MGGLGELLGGGGEPLLGALQVLLEQLDAAVQGGDLALGLQVVEHVNEYTFIQKGDRGSRPSTASKV